MKKISKRQELTNWMADKYWRLISSMVLSFMLVFISKIWVPISDVYLFVACGSIFGVVINFGLGMLLTIRFNCECGGLCEYSGRQVNDGEPTFACNICNKEWTFDLNPQRRVEQKYLPPRL